MDRRRRGCMARWPSPMVEDVNFSVWSGTQKPRAEFEIFRRPAQPLQNFAANVTHSEPMGEGWRRRDLPQHMTGEHVSQAGLLVEIQQHRVWSTNVLRAPYASTKRSSIMPSNCDCDALQTEEENPAGADAFSVDLKTRITWCSANLLMYRVSRNCCPS